MEALERVLAEIEVLESIYTNDESEEDDSTSFRVVSADALQLARGMIDQPTTGDDGQQSIPRLDIEVKLPISIEDGSTFATTTALLRCGMPPGYPISAHAIVSVDVPSQTRAVKDKLSKELNQRAMELLGEESILTIAQKLQEIGASILTKEKSNTTELDYYREASTSPPQTSQFRRQWLFMDHIKAESRRAQMIREATSLKVGGYIKPGYPGVCVVEGSSHQVEEFVSWMKQIWIGRVAVRGEVSIQLDDSTSLEDIRKLPTELKDLGEGKNLPNMGVLGSACRDAQLEDEFMEYIMQIRQNPR